MTNFNLYPYQKRAVKFIKQRGGVGGLFMEMGTGKSRTALAYLSTVKCRRILIVCPISVIGVWEREIKKVGLDWHILNLTGSGTAFEKARRFVRAARKVKGNTTAVALINYETYWRLAMAKELIRWQPDAIVMDEAHRLKGRSTQQSRFAGRLVPMSKHRLALTGTPITTGLQDLFAMYRFIDPAIFGTRWQDFENRYILLGGYQNRQIVGYQNQEEVRGKLERTAYQISKAEALDLPERTDVIMPVELSPKTREIYNEVRKFALAEIEGRGEDGLPKKGIVLARIVLSTILRLQQVACGFARTTEEEYIDLSDEKLSACRDLISDAVAEGHKIVVFARFIHDLDRLAAVVPRSIMLSGNTPQKDREPLLDEFRSDKYDVLLCQIQVGSLGIDLTVADIAVFYSTGFSLAEYLQARDRLHRHGQTRKVTTYHMAGVRTVDEKIIHALISKQQVAKQVVSLDYARQLLNEAVEEEEADPEEAETNKLIEADYSAMGVLV